MSVLDGVELAFVTGKGGVGKSTVALATALAAARDGRRVVLCEVAGQARAARLYGADASAARPRGRARGRAVGDDDRPRGGARGVGGAPDRLAPARRAADALQRLRRLRQRRAGRARAGGHHQGVGARPARALGQGPGPATTSWSSTGRPAATASACCAPRTRSPRSRASARSRRRRARSSTLLEDPARSARHRRRPAGRAVDQRDARPRGARRRGRRAPARRRRRQRRAAAALQRRRGRAA